MDVEQWVTGVKDDSNVSRLTVAPFTEQPWGKEERNREQFSLGVVSLLTGRHACKDVQLTTAYANLAFRTQL